jgi:hypothetical protein
MIIKIQGSLFNSKHLVKLSRWKENKTAVFTSDREVTILDIPFERVEEMINLAIGIHPPEAKN